MPDVQPPRDQDPRPLLVGHRGAAALEPENTVRAVRRGIADGADLVEFDVHLSADGQDVILHDPELDRTAAPASPLRHGRVDGYTRTELDTVLLEHGERLPRLAQMLDAAHRPDGAAVPALVEVKAPAAASLVVAALRERFPREAFADPGTSPAWVISFHPAALAAARAEAPEVPRMLIAHAVDDDFFAVAEELEVAQLSLRIRDCRPEDAARCREGGRRLNLWTARTEEQLDRALDLGCDTLTVDDPAWARRRLAGA